MTILDCKLRNCLDSAKNKKVHSVEITIKQKSTSVHKKVHQFHPSEYSISIRVVISFNSFNVIIPQSINIPFQVIRKLLLMEFAHLFAFASAFYLHYRHHPIK